MPPRRVPAPRGPVRPNYGRIVSALGAVGITAVALLASAGALPVSTAAQPSARAASSGTDAGEGPRSHSTTFRGADRAMFAPRRSVLGSRSTRLSSEALPAGSGRGRRVVFDMSAQRVWLVGDGETVRRTYLVSGSVTDNLRPGTYEVFSTSRHAVGIDDSGTMQFMVRFTHGDRAAIGFHDIPVDRGRLVQTRAQLGTPRSHGCIRQARPDARALWRFAPVGTTVVVTA